MPTQHGTDIASSKFAFDCGRIHSARVYPSCFKDGWNLELYGKSMRYIVTRQRGKEAVYRSINAACSAAHSVGFKTITVYYSHSA